MKLSEQWLREWVNPNKTREALSAELTLSGLEVESILPVSEKFSNVVVGLVVEVEKHPEADRLKVCKVNIGKSELLTIVCGAPNVRPDMKVPVALQGAVLPNNITIKRSKIRNVVSEGMLCSPVELGISDESAGLLELPQDAVLGQSIWEYFNFSDFVIEVAVTPNRGDCLSVLGLAKEIAALTESELTHPIDMSPVPPVISDQLTIELDEPEGCPRYCGRIIRGVNADAATPLWMKERLRRSGIRSISAIVDVMNYLMLELGQPMHSFDLQRIEGGIHVRLANQGETLTLLDGQTLTLNEEVLLIADDKKPLAIAGVMGGLDSAVTLLTKDIFLESAFFNPNAIARSLRIHKAGSESSYRYQRGIDPTLQANAIEYATKLILKIAGGTPAPLVDISNKTYLPAPKKILLRTHRIEKIIGIPIEESTIESILKRLGFVCVKNAGGFEVTVPARRKDVEQEIDLIEEVIRLYGYEELPATRACPELQINKSPENKFTVASIRNILSDLGYHEVITYSFIDKKMQKLLDPDNEPKALINPITADMTVMRTNLWPGLLNTFSYNQNRQQSRVRIFETGLRFINQKTGSLAQERVLGGLISGSVLPLQWGEKPRPVDFFDLKGDLETILKIKSGTRPPFLFKNEAKHAALHPGYTAEIVNRDGEVIGLCGALHPSILQILDYSDKIYVFEIRLDALEMTTLPQFKEISRFPEIRRDIAIFIDQTVPSQAIQDTIVNVGGNLLQEVIVFDVYEGKGVPPHCKSIALALTLQHESRTLVDEDVTDVVERVIGALKQRFAAELRG